MDLSGSLQYLDMNGSLDENVTTNDNDTFENDVDTNTFDEILRNYTYMCQDHIEIIHRYDPYTATVCGLYFVFGIVCTFFGYRCFKALMFFIGFLFASIVVYLICAEEAVLPEYGNAGVALSAGVLFGMITLLVQYVGLFMLGFHTGLLTGLLTLCAIEVFVHSQDPWCGLAILLATGLLFALFNLYFQKSLTIIGSSFYGGAIFATAADYFLQNSVNIKWIWARVKVDQVISNDENYAKDTLPKCWIAYALFSIWPFMFIIGLLVQSCYTGRGIHHEQSLLKVKYNKDLQETKEERKQRKYRYLYQVRMCHGDVISQVNRPISNKYIVITDDQYS